MRALIILLIFLVNFAAKAQDFVSGGGSAADKRNAYNLGVDIQLGYPSVKLGNPSGDEAIYDGLAIRGTLNIPIYKSKPFDAYLSPSIKYMDLENTANSEAQYESANLCGVGAGLTFRFRKLMFGGRWMQMYGRHFASGDFNDRANYNFQAVEAFGGVYFQFDRLGLGITYTHSTADIPKEKTGLEAATPYTESIISVQGTFDMGDSLWGILSSLF